MSDNDKDIFIVGVNGSNPQCIRKVVWAGKLVEVMTFAEAHAGLNGGKFARLRQHPSSPLHVQPIMDQREIVGYEHASDEHSGRDKKKPYDSWVYDLITNPGRDGVIVENDGQQDRKVICIDGNHGQVFDRDCCMLLENVFFASRHGVELDEVALDILRQAQPDERGAQAQPQKPIPAQKADRAGDLMGGKVSRPPSGDLPGAGRRSNSGYRGLGLTGRSADQGQRNGLRR